MLATACARVAPRVEPTAVTRSTEIDAWRAAGQALIADALATLRTFEEFAAYRVSVTPDSGQRSASTLAWDPPTSAAWDNATNVSRGLRDRANQLFQGISTASVDAAVWRTQREMAEASHDLMDLGEALRAYRDRLDRVAPGDAAGALELLNAAWDRWETEAPRWGMARAEAIGCGAGA